MNSCTSISAASERDPLDLIDLKALARLLALSPCTIRRKVKDGSFPRPIRLSEQTTRWRRRDVEQWLAERERGDDPPMRAIPTWRLRKNGDA